MGFELERFVSEIDDEYLCAICTLVLENPVQSDCEHIFCSKCINEWLDSDLSCPVERKILQPENLKPVPRYFRNMMDKLEIKCIYGKRISEIFIYCNSQK